MLTVTTLASGSSGNSALVSDGRTHVLVDAGISARRITRSLRELGVAPEELAGVLVTHEHTDHICGIRTLLKQLPLTVYASPGTGAQLCRRLPEAEGRLTLFAPGDTLEVGTLEVETFPTPHDTAQSVGYTLAAGGRKAAIVTDLGHVTPAVARALRGAHLLVAETNHDVEWVRSGPYPYFLKERILGNRGHLSNEAGAELVCQGVEWGAQTVVLAHLSAENNTPARALDTVTRALAARGIRPGEDVAVAVAPRAERGETYVV